MSSAFVKTPLAIGLLVLLSVLIVLTAIGLLVYFFEKSRNFKLHPNDPGYKSWMHNRTGTFVEVLIVIGVSVLLILFFAGIVAVLFFLPTTKVGKAEIEGRQSASVIDLESRIGQVEKRKISDMLQRRRTVVDPDPAASQIPMQVFAPPVDLPQPPASTQRAAA